MFREVPALVMAIAPVQPPETDRAYFCDPSSSFDLVLRQVRAHSSLALTQVRARSSLTVVASATRSRLLSFR